MQLDQDDAFLLNHFKYRLLGLDLLIRNKCNSKSHWPKTIQEESLLIALFITLNVYCKTADSSTEVLILHSE